MLSKLLKQILFSVSIFCVIASSAMSATMNYLGGWRTAIVYPAGSVVSYNNGIFYSLKSSSTAPNTNKNPVSSPTWWRRIGTVNTTELSTGLKKVEQKTSFYDALNGKKQMQYRSGNATSLTAVTRSATGSEPILFQADCDEITYLVDPGVLNYAQLHTRTQATLNLISPINELAFYVATRRKGETGQVQLNTLNICETSPTWADYVNPISGSLSVDVYCSKYLQGGDLFALKIIDNGNSLVCLKDIVSSVDITFQFTTVEVTGLQQ